MIRRPTDPNRVAWVQKASLLEDSEDYADAAEDLNAAVEELSSSYSLIEATVGSRERRTVM